MIVEKNYWYYTNGSYELESTRNNLNAITQVARNITGPCPFEDIRSIVRAGGVISPHAVNWQHLISQKLIQSRFRVLNIIAGAPQECGMTTKAFLKSFICWKTVLVVGSIGAVFLFPGFIGKFAPGVAKELGWTAYQGNLVTYSIGKWGAAVANVPSTAITGMEIVDGLLVAMTVTYVSKKLFKKLNETIGPKGFRAWKADKLDIFIQSQEDMIPEVYENDPVLAQKHLSYYHASYCVPCRTIYNHVFGRSSY